MLGPSYFSSNPPERTVRDLIHFMLIIVEASSRREAQLFKVQHKWRKFSEGSLTSFSATMYLQLLRDAVLEEIGAV